VVEDRGHGLVAVFPDSGETERLSDAGVWSYATKDQLLRVVGLTSAVWALIQSMCDAADDEVGGADSRVSHVYGAPRATIWVRTRLASGLWAGEYERGVPWVEIAVTPGRHATLVRPASEPAPETPWEDVLGVLVGKIDAARAELRV
jgi:hypothetical protein